MDHRAAVETGATERYLLGELDEPVRTAFEEHFFSCADCAEDVRTSARFVANAQAVLRARPVLEEDARAGNPAAAGAIVAWFTRRVWIPAALAASLVTAFVTPRLSQFQPQFALEVLPPAVQIPSAMRSGGGAGASTGSQSSPERAIRLAAGESTILLRLDVGDTITAPVLKWTVRGASGAPLVVTGPNQSEVLLRLPAAQFPAGGRYEVVLSSAAATPADAPVLDRYPFTIQPR